VICITITISIARQGPPGFSYPSGGPVSGSILEPRTGSLHRQRLCVVSPAAITEIMLAAIRHP
jgi:hypothetical protein